VLICENPWKNVSKNAMRYFIYFSVFSLAVFLYVKNDLFLDGTNRPTVTFIVGEDAEQENRYFSAAKKYYSTHDVDNQSHH
jgi:hypothetical protein